MKPEFVNYFMVRKNSINTELIVDFNHTYDASELVETDKKDELAIHSSVKSEKIASVVMTMHDAISLRNVLDNVINAAILESTPVTKDKKDMN